jgi:hypothetical protein
MSQTNTAKDDRRDRGKAIESEVHKVFRDRTLSIEERCTQGLTLLTTKLIDDIETQHNHICGMHPTHKSTVDAEMCRLLRMLEKRQKTIDKIEAALVSE